MTNYPQGAIAVECRVSACYAEAFIVGGLSVENPNGKPRSD